LITQALFSIRKQQFFELVEDREKQGDNALSELVASLKGLEGLCTGEQFKELCFFLTLARLSDHPEYREWSVAQGRYDTLSHVLQGLHPLYGSVAQKEVPDHLEVLLSRAVQETALRFHGEASSYEYPAGLAQAPTLASNRTPAQAVHASIDFQRLHPLPPGTLKGSESSSLAPKSIAPKKTSAENLKPGVTQEPFRDDPKRQIAELNLTRGVSDGRLAEGNDRDENDETTKGLSDILNADDSAASVDREPASNQKEKDNSQLEAMDAWQHEVRSEELSNTVHEEWQPEEVSSGRSEESDADRAECSEPWPAAQDAADVRVEAQDANQRRPVAWTIQFDSPTKSSHSPPSPQQSPPLPLPPQRRQTSTQEAAHRGPDESSVLSRAAPPLASRRSADRREEKTGASREGGGGGGGGLSLNEMNGGWAPRGEAEASTGRPSSRTSKRDGAARPDSRTGIKTKGDEVPARRAGGRAEGSGEGDGDRASLKDGPRPGSRKSAGKEVQRSNNGDASTVHGGSKEGDRRSVSTLGPMGVTMTRRYSPPASPRNNRDPAEAGSESRPARQDLLGAPQRQESVEGGSLGGMEWYGRGGRAGDHEDWGAARMVEGNGVETETRKVEFDADSSVPRGGTRAWVADGGPSQNSGRPWSEIELARGQGVGVRGAGLAAAGLDATGLWAPGVLRTALDDKGFGGFVNGEDGAMDAGVRCATGTKGGHGRAAWDESAGMHGASMGNVGVQRRETDSGREGLGVERGRKLADAGLGGVGIRDEGAGRVERAGREDGSRRGYREGEAGHDAYEHGARGPFMTAGQAPVDAVRRWAVTAADNSTGDGVKGDGWAGMEGFGGWRDDVRQGGGGGSRRDGGAGGAGREGRQDGGVEVGVAYRSGREADWAGGAVRARGAGAWIEGQHGWEGLAQRASLEEEDVVRVVAWRPAGLGSGPGEAVLGMEGATLAVGTTGGSVRVARVVGDSTRGARGGAGLEGVYCMGNLHKGSVYALVWSRDGSAMASASNDKTICVVRNGSEPIGHTPPTC
jgi:hypothetical protein